MYLLGASQSSTGGCRCGGRSRPWWSARRSLCRARGRRPARRRPRPPRPGGDARDARLLGLAPAQLALPGRRGHVLVRSAGAGRRARVSRRSSRRCRPSPSAARAGRARAAVVHATLAVLGFDVMRWLLRAVLPISLAFTAVLIGLYSRPTTRASASGTCSRRREQHLTWTGFATYVTVMAGASLTLVGSIADFCRYTPTRRDMRIGLSPRRSPPPRDDLRRRLRGRRDRRNEPVRRRVQADLEHRVLVPLAGAIVVQGSPRTSPTSTPQAFAREHRAVRSGASGRRCSSGSPPSRSPHSRTSSTMRRTGSRTSATSPRR